MEFISIRKGMIEVARREANEFLFALRVVREAHSGPVSEGELTDLNLEGLLELRGSTVNVLIREEAEEAK